MYRATIWAVLRIPPFGSIAAFTELHYLTFVAPSFPQLSTNVAESDEKSGNAQQ